jgi:hypothetical protein
MMSENSPEVRGDMARTRAKAKGRRESGTFIAIPHAVVNHDNYRSLKPRSVKLLIDLCNQIKRGPNGYSNNGDLTTAWSVISKSGWTSRDQLHKAQVELEEKGFIVKTRQGGRVLCNLYAVTFYAIDECGGKLDVAPTAAAPGNWKN